MLNVSQTQIQHWYQNITKKMRMSLEMFIKKQSIDMGTFNIAKVCQGYLIKNIQV